LLFCPSSVASKVTGCQPVLQETEVESLGRDTTKVNRKAPVQRSNRPRRQSAILEADLCLTYQHDHIKMPIER
jgi:hypothetical protein